MIYRALITHREGEEPDTLLARDPHDWVLLHCADGSIIGSNAGEQEMVEDYTDDIHEAYALGMRIGRVLSSLWEGTPSRSRHD